MRTSIVVLLMISGCSAPSMPVVDAGHVDVAVKPMRLEANPKTYVYGEIYDDGVAVDEQRFDFALGEPYPQIIDVHVEPAYITRGCANGLKFGKERFLALSNVTGDAAELSVVNGQLHVELKHEGLMSATLTGEIYDVMCERNGELKTTIPARHLVELRVSTISKFSITHVAQGPRCGTNPLIIASARPTSFPWVNAHEAGGALFQPMNAPDPVSVTLRAADPVRIEETDAGVEVHLPVGRTAIELGTSLPIEGMQGIISVAPTDVTIVVLELGVMRANLKGSEWVTLVDDATVRIHLPDEDNFVAVRTTYVDTTMGTMCGSPGLDWFVATTETPSTCVPASGDDFQVAKIIGPGTCSVKVKLRETSSNWSMRFTTTN